MGQHLLVKWNLQKMEVKLHIQFLKAVLTGGKSLQWTQNKRNYW